MAEAENVLVGNNWLDLDSKEFLFKVGNCLEEGNIS